MNNKKINYTTEEDAKIINDIIDICIKEEDDESAANKLILFNYLPLMILAKGIQESLDKKEAEEFIRDTINTHINFFNETITFMNSKDFKEKGIDAILAKDK